MYDLRFFGSECMGMEEGILKSCEISSWGFDGSETAVGLSSLFPSKRKMDYINNLLWWKTVYEAKCNTVCNVIRDLQRKSVIETRSMSMDTDPSQPEMLGSRWQIDALRKGPLPVLVCILKSPFPASVTNTTGVFSLVHFFNVFTFSDQDSVLSYFSLLYPTSATHQNETSNWLELWKPTFFLSQTNAKQHRMVFHVNLNYSGLPLFSCDVKSKMKSGKDGRKNPVLCVLK